MLGKSLLGLFCLQKPDDKFFGRFRHESNLTNSDEDDASQSSGSKSHQRPMWYLPHTIVTSDLGYRDHKFKLRFNRFLAEDPSIAVFSVDQEAPVSSTWRNERSRNNCRLSSKYGRARLLVTGRSHCNATITIGHGWPFGVSMKEIRYWNAEDGILLVNWSQLYSSYFAQAEKRSIRRKDGKIVDAHRYMEGSASKSEPERSSKYHGDGSVTPVADAQIVTAHQHAGQDLHDSFRRTGVRHESQGVNGVVKRQVDERWKIHKRVEAFVCSPGPLWRTSGYQKMEQRYM
ncbi:hypothetical protein GMOD_00006360 [Pyrenophora seminiperda CCB06]|uniref:Uncharacterized protein n=1 Tax=Pyrenophora seminiperda CCB06 TaxID=1302712 RepID=A0A3M7M4W1_9PLEO|nr:hypothetical protein GMOD_00006360 [Pyrenophora seminiperda CCB06]